MECKKLNNVITLFDYMKQVDKRLSNDDVFEEFVEYLRDVDNKSDKTIRQYKVNLTEFKLDVFNNEDVTISKLNNVNIADLQRWLNKKEFEGLKAQSLNSRIATVRKLYDYLIGMNLSEKNPARIIKKYKESTVKNKKTEKGILTVEQSRKLLNTATEERIKNPKYDALRNEIIISLFLSCGLRIEEVSELEINQIDFATGRIYLTNTKFGKPRQVQIDSTLLDLFKVYMEERSKIRKESIYLLVSRQSDNLSTRQILNIVNKLLDLAGIEKDGITPHSLRHTCGTLLLEAGVPLVTVSKMLGHSDISITSKWYIHQTEDDLKGLTDINPIFR